MARSSLPNLRLAHRLSPHATYRPTPEPPQGTEAPAPLPTRHAQIPPHPDPPTATAARRLGQPLPSRHGSSARTLLGEDDRGVHGLRSAGVAVTATRQIGPLV